MLQRFIKILTTHTVAAMSRWGYMDRGVSKATWNQVLMEEVGKLSRCCNKLSLATDISVREKWNKEAKHRLVTIASVCARMYEAYDNLPDADKGYKTDNTLRLRGHS